MKTWCKVGKDDNRMEEQWKHTEIMLNYDKCLPCITPNQWHLCHSRKCSTADHRNGGVVLTRGCDPWDELPVTITGVPPLPIQYSKPSDQCPQTQYPPPRKTNYLSILYCQVPSMLCLCRVQLVKESIKKMGGGTGEGGTIAEGERRSLRKTVTAKEATAGRRHEGRAECVTEQTVHW